ncbi:MAPEG family-domain-containing protein [Xylariomycetidae sp. FL0641]|nr:MAPEG family-domain-containing protein [Xylariomycetidae sp. FL0641]
MAANVGLTQELLSPLLPVTGGFALPFTAYFSFLSYRVVAYRLNTKTYLGDNSLLPSEQRNADKLYLATRCHQNFVENVPLAFALAAVVELNGGSRKALTNAMGLLFALRVFQAEFGLMKGLGLGRPVGYWGTMATLSYLGGYAAYLVKGYWGY